MPEDISLDDLQDRARIDICTRREILYAFRSKKTVIDIPDIKGSKTFWSYVAKAAKKMRRGCGRIELRKRIKVEPYHYNKPCVLAYSGGAESSLIKFIFQGIDTFTLNKKKIWSNPVEGLLPMVGAGLGYWSTFHGDELGAYESLSNMNDAEPYFFETTAQYRALWKVYSGGSMFLSPLAAMTKDEVIKRCLEAGIKFCSCSKSRLWCRKCWKCAEVYYVALRSGLKPPLQHTFHAEKR